jgi:hypothetical protein
MKYVWYDNSRNELIILGFDSSFQEVVANNFTFIGIF